MSADLTKLMQKHRFFDGLAKKDIARLAGCGGLRTMPANRSIATEGTPATEFIVLLDGRVAIETTVPGKPPITLQTVEAGDVIGWSWIDAQSWVFDVRTLTDCEAIVLNGPEVMKVLTSDSALGFEMMRRLNRVVSERLGATRLQLLDIYGRGASED